MVVCIKRWKEVIRNSESADMCDGKAHKEAIRSLVSVKTKDGKK